MKKTIVLLLGFIMANGLTQAQKDIMYAMKSGEGINKLKAVEVDSIITVRIPGGTFTMGSPADEVDRGSGEIQHEVTLRAFLMSKYEITNAQYAAFLNAKGIGSDGKWAAGAYPTQALIYVSSGNDFGLHYTSGQWVSAVGYEDHPVIMVTWYGATEFAKYVGGRLPTEAEWEYACRANTTSPFETGYCLNNKQANYDWCRPYSDCTNTITTSLGTPQAVGSYPPNAYGLYDMHGNVWEWCSDWFGTYPTTAQTNPTGPATGTQRVKRGGSWTAFGQWCRSARHGGDIPEYQSIDLGFRVVMDIDTTTIFYVKENGTGDGSSWANASGNIQSMIDLSIRGDQVWVAKGTYHPTKELESGVARSRTFQMKDGVSLYGGFAGTETAINQRVRSDLDSNGKIDSFEFTNVTLLSGDIDGVSDVWTKIVNSDGKTWTWAVTGNEGNCYRVVVGQITETTYFDGFSLKGGNADTTSYASGGGICVNSYYPFYASSHFSVTNCMVTNCFASYDGGGIFISDNSIFDGSSVTNCAVMNCSAGSDGGGICALGFSASATNCVVSNCSAGSSGGGIYVLSNPAMGSAPATNCTVSNCSAGSDGGGIFAYGFSAYVTNCVVSNCSAGSSGGGIFANGRFPHATSCVVSNCSAGSSGGGIYSSAYSNGITNCTVTNCSASDNGGGIYSSTLTNGITNCTVTNCSASDNGGGIYSYSLNGDITNCIVTNCSTSDNGGGIYSSALTSDITNCIVTNCSTSDNGGGIYSSGHSFVTNCLVANGSALYGGGIYLYNASSVTNCAVANCFAFNEGGGIYADSVSVVKNCAASNNKKVESTPSDIYDGTQSGNISPDIWITYEKPTSFVGADTLGIHKDELDSLPPHNWSLREGSPCINAGTMDISSYILSGTDLIGNPRVQQGIIDIGAYESSFFPVAIDVNNDDKLSYTTFNGNLLIRNLDVGATVQLFDVNGKLLAQKQTDANQAQFLLPQRGVYLVKIHSSSGLKSGKIVW